MILKLILYSIIFSYQSKAFSFFFSEESIPLHGHLAQTRDSKSYQLQKLGELFLEKNAKIMMPLSKRSIVFLETLSKRILNNNTLLLPSLNEIKVSIIQDQKPLHFSFPGGKIVLSTGLLVRYIKEEGTLAAILAFEAIKTSKDLYLDQLSYPVGVISLEKAVKFNQSTLEERLEVNKWAYLILKRSRYNPSALLNYIQN